jgi:hypothetical protein
MPTVAFRNSARTAAVGKANSVRSPGWHRVTPGALLIYCLLFSGIVGKSHLFLLLRQLCWRVQMAVVAVTVMIGLILHIQKHSLTRIGRGGGELPLRIKACLTGLLCIGISSCIAQEDVLGNLAFLLVYAGMVYLLCVRGADLLESVSRKRCMDIALVPLGLMVVSSLILARSSLSWASYHEELSGVRFKGIYSDAIIAGQMFGLTCLLLFWSILHTRSVKRFWHWVLLPIAGVCLVVTRTRTDIVGTTVGMTVCLVAAMRSRTAAMPRHRARAILGVLALLVIMSAIWLWHAPIEAGRGAEYLRISGDLDRTLQNRLEYWETGASNVALTNVFGQGPLAKFGGQLSTQRSTYDRELNAHNAILSFFQYYGWPGGVLFIIFLVSVGDTFMRRRDPYAVLGLSLLAFGCVQCIGENWLLSFGTPVDAYSWFILGLTLTYKSPSTTHVVVGNACNVRSMSGEYTCPSPYSFRR